MKGSTVHVKVEPRSTFTFKGGLSCISFYIISARKIYVRTGVRITRQWKSTLRRAGGYDDLCQW